MYQISDEQVTYILNDIRRRGVEMEDLQLNLLDHVCCIIEQNLETGGDFEGFYEQTIVGFHPGELKEIEEETINLLTFKNYYFMKRSMVISGASSAFLLLIGSIFKIAHWPGAGVLLVLGIVFFSLIFLPILYMLKFKELDSLNDKLVLGIGTSMGALFCLAVLFKVMHWPGANVMWILAIGISSIVLLPLYFFSGIRKPEKRLNTLITSFILIGVLGVLLTLTQLRRVPADVVQTVEQKHTIKK